MSIQNLSFFSPAGIATSYAIPNGQPGDKVVSINIIAGNANHSVGEDVTNNFSPTLDGTGKISQLNGVTDGAATYLALLARGF
jgi:hypothetical protein